MTVSEKLQLMETLWEDLSRNVDALESPEWHRDVLEERERRIASGEARFSDWEEAKAGIRERVMRIEVLDDAEDDLVAGFHF